jgi:hypothetical protein
MPDERSKVLDQVAEHFEARATELDEFYRRFGEKERYDSAVLGAKADGFREAAVYARTLRADGQAQAPRTRKPRQRREEAKTEARTEPQAPARPQPAAPATRPQPPLPTGA